jgi:dual specificity tyrosine-phosphorylation-regulated kinase 2/3/4
VPRTIRTRPSIAEESGGEEILYPRAQFPKPPTSAHSLVYSPTPNTATPPTAFSPLTNKTRKRTSDEFERDQIGTLVEKHQRTPSGSILDGNKEERASTRKHRSLGVGVPSRERLRERRKDSISTSGSATRDRHSRHASASSSSSSHGEQLHSRRVHTTDFSHLPPSPSTTSIQQFLRHTGSNSAIGASPPVNSQKETQNHHSPNVAHSLLRGTQEGWSELDDHATVEALRKLDGLSGKTATRVRSSVGSLRLAGSSRPGTPSKSAQQWEGVGSDSGKTSRRSSMHIRDSTSLTKDKDQTPSASRQVAGVVDTIDISEQAASVFGSSDETQLSSPAQEKPPTKKSSASMRLSYTTKRGSASSTTYASTPTTSSRDSGSMSAGTSLTSISAQSGRHSSKARRNSGGSDASQSDVTALKDRAASLVTEQVEVGQDVPPVPPLPKDLSTYRSPPQSSAGASFPVEGVTEEESTQLDDAELNRSAPAEAAAVPGPSVSKSSPPPPYTSHGESQGYTSAPAVMKTPSKKWSLLGMKLSGTPSANTTKDNSNAKTASKRHSPHSATFSQPNRHSISRDPSEPWSPVQQPGAMTSAASLISQSSLSSSHALSTTGAPAGTPDRHFPSRPGTASSSHKSSSLAAAPQQTPLSPSGSIRRGTSKRLTPSAIPFFRRSSSQSGHVSALRSSSPPASTGPSHLQSRDPVSPVDSSLSTPSGAHKKTSIISLGSLLKGSTSRRNLQAGKDEPRGDRESRRARDTDGGKSDKEKAKKEEKDRSESRISVLMGRKRGKVGQAHCKRS